MYPATIEAAYRVVTTSYGGGDNETTIPLGSWRKGGGLEGSKGHVYSYSPSWAGVWIKTRYPRARISELLVDFANLVTMQIGQAEGTFRVPVSDLDRLLPLIGAKRRFKSSPAQLLAKEKGRNASPIAKKPSREHQV